MMQFTYAITDPLGLHARPAGVLVKMVSRYESSVSITKGDKTVDAKRVFALMGLAVKHGDVVTFTVEGADEAKAAGELELFVRENL